MFVSVIAEYSSALPYMATGPFCSAILVKEPAHGSQAEVDTIPMLINVAHLEHIQVIQIQILK